MPKFDVANRKEKIVHHIESYIFNSNTIFLYTLIYIYYVFKINMQIVKYKL